MHDYPPVRVDLAGPAVHNSNWTIAALREAPHLTSNLVAVPQIIGIEGRDQTPSRRGQRCVTGRSDALVRLTDESEPLIHIGHALNNLRGFIL
jgi:hypothetical protein